MKILDWQTSAKCDTVYVLMWRYIISGKWKQKICSYRDWFLNEGAMKTDESKRPGKAIDTTELFGFEGSFRQLNLD